MTQKHTRSKNQNTKPSKAYHQKAQSIPPRMSFFSFVSKSSNSKLRSLPGFSTNVFSQFVDVNFVKLPRYLKRDGIIFIATNILFVAMVGIFSKFTNNKSGHRRTQSAVDERKVLPPSSESGGDATPSVVAHGIEVAVEFRPVERPTEPLDSDTPVVCPLPEPSILNDGRLWKERASAVNVRRRADLPLMKEGSGGDSGGSNRMMSPSLSAPEHNILKMLDECNASPSGV